MGPYKAKYGTRLPLYYYDIDEEIPQIVVEIPSNQVVSIKFVLSPQSIVRLVNPPIRELTGLTNSWGNLQEKLRISQAEQYKKGTDNLQFEVMIEKAVWIAPSPERISACIKDLIEHVEELRKTIRGRNLQIKNLRKSQKKSLTS